MSKQENFFKTKFVPVKEGYDKLFDEEIASNEGPVVCLGQEYKNDAARREHFTNLLRGKLKDPEFRKFEGFPIGEDEDILTLSDPPYYTACPNPWIGDFIKEWESQKPEKPKDWQYHREPFAADVSEGKNDPIYNAHSYHTKVPHKAIMRYILHYTEPGDIVFDGFCGTGMTGVAAQMCGDKEAVESLGVTKDSPERKYQVDDDGTIKERQIDEEGKEVWRPISALGARRAVLNDLSPSATSISKMYNSSIDKNVIKKEACRVIEELNKNNSWMYKTRDPETGKECQITSTIWSTVYYCPNCNEEIVFWDAAVDTEKKRVRAEIGCPSCGKRDLVKGDLGGAHETFIDPFRQESRTIVKRKAVLIEYEFTKGRKKKKPDAHDLELLKCISAKGTNYFFPDHRIDKDIDLWYERDYRALGVDNVLDFFSIRAICCISSFRHLINQLESPNTRDVLNWVLTAVTEGSSLMNRERPGGMPSKLSGTLYIGALIREINPIAFIERKLKKFLALKRPQLKSSVTATQSMTELSSIENNCLDYMFLDPPFGSNIIYSDLSILWEAWMSVFTNSNSEAVVHRRKKQNPNTLRRYMGMMAICFKEAYRVLKPGRWMTVEFSNTKASVWNSIQTALTEAGFIVANVSALDKKQGSFKAVTTPTAVKQDLVISAYKPNGGFEERFIKEAQTEEGVWDFIRTHLKYLPVIKKQGKDIAVVPERDPRILFDQVVAYYVRKGYSVPVSSQDFQLGLAQRFSERDGMYFLPEQVAEYDRKKMIGGGRAIQESLFVSDEASSINWLRNLLRDKPQTFQDLNPLFMKEINGWNKNEKPVELSTLLDQNFLCYDGKGPVPEQIHSYLSTNWKDMRNLQKDDPSLIAKAKDRWYVPDPNKAGDLEKLREKSLMKEFEEYKASKKKLKLFRLEAVRAGFKKCWQDRDYVTIINVAEKIPNNILEEDPKLLMWYDQAVTRMGGK